MIEIVLGKVAAPGFVSACGVPMRGSRNSDPPKWFRRHGKKAPASSRGFRDSGGLDQ
jgi:hypothetical protein